MSDTGCKVLRRHNQLSSIGGINDVVIDPSEKIVLTVGQVLISFSVKYYHYCYSYLIYTDSNISFTIKDRKINKYSLNSMKLVGTFKEEAELGQPVKVQFIFSSLPFILLTVIVHRSWSIPLEVILFALTQTSL